MTSLEFDLGLGSGLALAGSLYLVLWWWAKRTTSDGTAKRPLREVPRGALEGSEDDSPIPPGATITAAVDPSPAASPPSSLALFVPATAADHVEEAGSGPGDRAFKPGDRPATNGVVRLSQRVILHVYAQGTFPPGDVAPESLCQAGIGAALGTTQSGLAAVLRRLEAAGVVTGVRGHVRGRERRLKIYQLTPRGLELAKDLRRRSARSPAMAVVEERSPRPRPNASMAGLSPRLRDSS